jgi:pimeloyl-ACP methyl ester carboxylesterase
MVGSRAEAVVLVHGLWMSRGSLLYLARGLTRAGFRCYRFRYQSVRSGLRANAERMNAFVATVPEPVVHFVGHSLGGVVIRALFHYFPEQRPGRIVTLAAPHQGSRVADRLLRSRMTARALGRSVAELATGTPAGWRLPDRDIGVIEGTLPVGFGQLFERLDGPHDGLLTASETRLAGARDTIALRVSHSAMLLSNAVREQTCEFLRYGRFRRS